MSERVWTELPAAAADGLACGSCGRSFWFCGSPVRVPVGRSHTGSPVFACIGDCAGRASTTPDVLPIPPQALTAGGAAFLAVLEGAGGALPQADPDDLVSKTGRAASPLVVAVELRRISAELLARADELDPARGEPR